MLTMHQRLGSNILPFWKQFWQNISFHKTTDWLLKQIPREALGPSMLGLCINNSKKGLMFISSLWIIAVFQLFTDHGNYVECLSDHSASANAFSIFGYRYQFPFGILSWRRESSSIVTSPLIRLVNLQSSGYFWWRHEFLGFLGCGERSTVECTEHSHSRASLWRKYAGVS